MSPWQLEELNLDATEKKVVTKKDKKKKLKHSLFWSRTWWDHHTCVNWTQHMDWAVSNIIFVKYVFLLDLWKFKDSGLKSSAELIGPAGLLSVVTFKTERKWPKSKIIHPVCKFWSRWCKVQTQTVSGMWVFRSNTYFYIHLELFIFTSDER